jgi:hypothetical protein
MYSFVTDLLECPCCGMDLTNRHGPLSPEVDSRYEAAIGDAGDRYTGYPLGRRGLADAGGRRSARLS